MHTLYVSHVKGTQKHCPVHKSSLINVSTEAVIFGACWKFQTLACCTSHYTPYIILQRFRQEPSVTCQYSTLWSSSRFPASFIYPPLCPQAFCVMITLSWDEYSHSHCLRAEVCLYVVCVLKLSMDVDMSVCIVVSVWLHHGVVHLKLPALLSKP